MKSGTHYRTTKEVSFTDEVLDGPAFANHSRYSLEAPGLIKSFEVAKKSTTRGDLLLEQYGNITNVVLNEPTRDQAIFTRLGLVEDIRENLVLSVYDYPRFVTQLGKQLGGKHTQAMQRLMEELESDMGINKHHVKSSEVTTITFPPNLIVTSIDVVRSTDRNGRDPKISFDNVKLNAALLLSGIDYEKHKGRASMLYTSSFFALPEEEKAEYYQTSDRLRTEVGSSLKAAGIMRLEEYHVGSIEDVEKFSAYLRANLSDAAWREFAATTAIDASQATKLNC